jgi:hypothetical protein
MSLWCARVSAVVLLLWYSNLFISTWIRSCSHTLLTWGKFSRRETVFLRFSSCITRMHSRPIQQLRNCPSSQIRWNPIENTVFPHQHSAENKRIFQKGFLVEKLLSCAFPRSSLSRPIQQLRNCSSTVVSFTEKQCFDSTAYLEIFLSTGEKGGYCLDDVCLM